MTLPPTRRGLAIAPDVAASCALVVVAPQLFGGAFPWTVVAIAALSLVAFGMSLVIRRESAPPRWDAVAIAMVGAWAFTCAQAWALPEGVARAMRLGSVERADRLEGLAWAGDIPLTISQDPGNTRLHVLVGLAIVAAFLAARTSGPAALRPIAAAVVGSAALLGIEGFAHEAAGVDAVFGLYVPRFSRPQLLTPVMNGNHLGGLAVLGTILAAGLALRSDGPGRRAWAAGSVFCGVVVAATLSRGAIGSALFGLLLLGFWVFQDHGSRRAHMLMPAAVVGAAVAGTLAFAGLEPILRRFETQGFDKLGVALLGFRLLEGPSAWLGVGRGAFSAMFVAEEGSNARYTHPENIVVQWTTEWGLLIALLLFVVLAVALFRRLRSANDPLVAASCIGIFALTLQNLVDFSLEMAGVAVVAAAVLGALLPAASAEAPARTRGVYAALAGLFVLTLVWLGPSVARGGTQSTIDRLTRAMEADRENEFVRALRAGLAAHPAEPTLTLLAGTYAGEREHADAPAWLAITMEQAPGWAAPHAVASQWLFERGLVDQALLEVREAETRHAASAHRELCAILVRFPALGRVERAAPPDELRVPYLDRAAGCARLPRELAAAIDDEILKAEPRHASATLREAKRLSREQRFDEAVALLEGALAESSGDTRLWVAIIGAELGAGRPEAAQATLERARALGLEGRPLGEAAARVAAALGDAEGMRATLTRLRGQARGNAAWVARSFILEGQLEASLGRIDAALDAYVAADRADPTGRALQYAAELARASERPTQARRFYRTLCTRAPDGPACRRESELSGPSSVSNASKGQP